MGDLLDCYVAEGVHGAYVFDFIHAAFPHAADPRADLDMAAYGLVKVRPGTNGDTSVTWERKASFDAVGKRYRVQNRVHFSLKLRMRACLIRWVLPNPIER